VSEQNLKLYLIPNYSELLQYTPPRRRDLTLNLKDSS